MLHTIAGSDADPHGLAWHRPTRVVATPTHHVDRIAWVAALALALVVWVSQVEAQIFAKGARTEFISGFGFRTFVSFLEADRRRVPVGDEADSEPRQRRVRATPLVVVYGVRPSLSVVAVLPFVDKVLGTPAGDLGGDGGLGDSVFLTKRRFYKRDRGRGTLQFAVEGGVKAPTGSITLRDAGGDLLPAPLQRGSGSWDPTADIIVTYAPPGGRWMFGGDAGVTATTEADAFEFGNRVSYDGMVKYRVHPARYPGRDVFLLLELNGRWQWWARASGQPVFDSGGHSMYLSPGVQFLWRQNLILEAGVQLPVRRSFNGRQLEPD